MMRRCLLSGFLGFLSLGNYPLAFVDSPATDASIGASVISIKNGYFWDPALKNGAGDYWIPRGVAYQTWNAGIGQWQTREQIIKDLDGMQNLGANSIRVDFVWGHIETGKDVYNWENYDFLLEEVAKRGIRVFPLVGYQWPPKWFSPELHTMHPPDAEHDQNWISDIIGYEDPASRAEFAEFLSDVGRRYSKGGKREDLAPAVGGWIVGNEYGYVGLWSRKYDGYDKDSLNAFRKWLSRKYKGDISKLNSTWRTDNQRLNGYLPRYPYKSFSEVDMATPYGAVGGGTSNQYLPRDMASWFDLTQWREDSIAGFVALAAKSIRKTDPHHLVSYSTVGMMFAETDNLYHTEDISKIVEACREKGVPLDFFSINNYPWGLKGDELMTGKWGIARAIHHSGLPVLLTETGFTSSETIYQLGEKGQADFTRNSLWEALESGVIGVHVFHWNDRPNRQLPKREHGFGLVSKDGSPKPAYHAVKKVYGEMKRLPLADLLVGSREAKPDIAFYWDDAIDTIHNRYILEIIDLFGVFERLGFEPYFMGREELHAGKWREFKVIVFPRNQKMYDDVFGLLKTIVKGGVKIHAGADLPGILNEYGKERGKQGYLENIGELFGIDAARSEVDFNLNDNKWIGGFESGSGNRRKKKVLHYPAINYRKPSLLWKFRDGIALSGGRQVASFVEPQPSPAVVLHNYDKESGHYGTAISLFSLNISNMSLEERALWLKELYFGNESLGVEPVLMVSNHNVLVDYRVCASRDILISLRNYSSKKDQLVNIRLPGIKGKTIYNLLAREDDGSYRIVDRDGNDNLTYQIGPNEHVLLIARSVTGSNYWWVWPVALVPIALIGLFLANRTWNRKRKPKSRKKAG
jgi:GH35 family endo-1,4-beta-xylanase